MQLNLRTELAALEDDREPYVHALAFSPGGALAIAVPGTVFVHDLATGARTAVHRVVRHGDNPHTGMPREAVFGSDARTLIVAVSVPDEEGHAVADRRTLQIFGATDDEPRAVLPAPGGPGISAWGLDPSRELLVVADEKGGVSVLDLETQTPRGALQLPPESLRGAHVAAVAMGRTGVIGVGIVPSEDAGAYHETGACDVRIYRDLQATEPLSSACQESARYLDLRRMTFDPASENLIVVGQVPSWSVGSLSAAEGSRKIPWTKVSGHPDSVIWLAPDGARIALLGRDRETAQLWLVMRPVTGPSNRATRVDIPSSEAWAIDIDGARYAVGAGEQVIVEDFPLPAGKARARPPTR